MIRKLTVNFCCFALLFSATSTHAEHRVALLVINTDYKDQPKQVSRLDAVQQVFEQHGFRCQVVQNLSNEKAFRETIEAFTSRTPTRSTAAFYFQGRLGNESNLLAVDSRGKYSLEKLVTSFDTRGGSALNLLFFDVQGKAEIEELPETTQVEFGDTESLLKKLAENKVLQNKASMAISPPDTFVVGKRAGDEWVNDMGLVFCWCPSGTFTAGSPKSVPGRYADEAQREVSMKQGFWLAKYELPFGQPIAKRQPGRSAIAEHKLDPMTMINHDDAKAMTRNLTLSEQKAGRLPSDWQYTLPTEDQWEYAARAGTTTRFYFGDDMSKLPLYANFGDKSFYESGDIFSNSAHRTLNDGVVKLARVGSYQPNSWGFHDMHGNVADWCINSAIRGGSWVSVPENCRSAYRDSFSSRNEQNFIGYRIVIQRPAEGSQ